jgi:hypothetical protein
VVLIASLEGGVETPSYGLGLACARRNGELRTSVATAAKEKRVFFIAVPNLKPKRSITALTD